MNAVVLVLRVLLGAVLLVAGLLKVGHATDLAAAMAGFRLLWPAIVAPLALALPWIEIVLGAYLVLGLFTRVAGILTAVQFMLYAGAIASAVVRHLPVNCGCFGPYDTATADWPHVALDLILVVVAAVIAHGAPGAYALDRRMNRS